MKLSQILEQVPYREIIGPGQVEVRQLAIDSRRVQAGDFFFALPGSRVDGQRFIDQALEAGAVAVLAPEAPAAPRPGVAYVVAADPALALGLAADNFFGKPSSKLRLVGVTGTNGKSTTVHLLYHLFQELGHPAGLVSTIANRVGRQVEPSRMTTPDALELHALMARMVEAGCEYCFMEVSSHAMVQNRVAGLRFRGGVFTNLTRDHLDYHKTFANYLAAKKSFFDQLPKDAFALSNFDDKNGRVMLQNCKASQHGYGLRSMAEFKARLVESHMDALCLELGKDQVWVGLPGEFNAYNLLAAYAVGRLLGVGHERLLPALSVLPPVDGRFQALRSASGVVAVVDYAHTPDALLNVLEAIAKATRPGQRVITVVGAGGDRDPGKRPMMAKAAVEHSDRVYLTSDNPRSEDPEEILRQMMAGVPLGDLGKVETLADRESAIARACREARPGDVVLVAGKGHETYQEIKGQRLPFDDREAVRRAFQSLA